MTTANQTVASACHCGTAIRVPRWFGSRGAVALATVVAVGVFVAAGNWQGRRLEQKEALRAQFDAAQAVPAVPLPAFPDADWASWRYRTVLVDGVFDASRQILVDNRVHAGRAGYEVVAPLRLADGSTVLVDRGWAPLGASRSEPPRSPPPAGPVRLVGRVAVPPAPAVSRQEDAAGPVWQRFDPATFAAATGVAVLPIVVEQLSSPPDRPADTLVRDRPAPDFGAEKHRIYRAQWYAFAALAAGLWCYFNLVRGRRRRGGAA
jgi:surfeit locus 1 family protein